MLIQVAAGLVLYAGDRAPAEGFHVFYGVVIVITFALAYLYRAPMRQAPGALVRVAAAVRDGAGAARLVVRRPDDRGDSGELAGDQRLASETAVDSVAAVESVGP